MRSRAAAAALFAALLLAPPAAAQKPAVSLSPAALRRRAVACKVPSSPVRFHLRRPTPVGVEILMDERGRVRDAEAVSGHPLLRASAVQAAREWVFRPVRVKGRRATAGGVLSLVFSLDAGEMEKQCEGLRRAP